jgi:hypothetical protein
MVLEPVEVRDPQQRLVTGLTQENFRISEDGVEQRISYFITEDVPASIGVISMNPEGVTLAMQEELVQLQRTVPVKIEFIEAADPKLTFRDATAAAMDRIRKAQTHTANRIILALDADNGFPGVLTFEEAGVTLVSTSPGLNDPVRNIVSYLQGKHYILGYTPTNRSADGTFRRIRVIVGLPNLRVNARTGYYALENPLACKPLPGLPPNATCH